MKKYTVIARTNNFAYGNNYTLFVDADTPGEAIAQYSKQLLKRGEQINSISATLATKTDVDKGITY